jgi:hypothetical protein
MLDYAPTRPLWQPQLHTSGSVSRYLFGPIPVGPS